MVRKNILNILLLTVAAWVLYNRAPTIINHFRYQDQKALDFTLKTLNGDSFTLGQQSKKMVIVFWATWCGPCEVELKRINQMIADKKILPTDVLAIVSQEDEKIIANKVSSEKYLFMIGIDHEGIVANNFQVRATPTIIFLDKDQTINWMTSGISPTLQYRISSFIN